MRNQLTKCLACNKRCGPDCSVYQIKQAEARSAYQKWLKAQGKFSYEPQQVRAKGINYGQGSKRTERKQTYRKSMSQSPGLGAALKSVPIASGLALPHSQKWLKAIRPLLFYAFQGRL